MWSHHPTGVYNITRTRAWAEENPIISGPFRVMAPTVQMLERDPTIDKTAAIAIPLHVATADPLLCVQLPSRHLLVLDGHKRLLRIVRDGIKVFRSYIVPPGFQPPLIAPQMRRIADCTDDQLASRAIAKDVLSRFPNQPLTNATLSIGYVLSERGNW
jgi:hypothetical protein